MGDEIELAAKTSGEVVAALTEKSGALSTSTAAATLSAMISIESREVSKPARSGKIPLYSATSPNETP
jgi:hypothetical protein